MANHPLGKFMPCPTCCTGGGCVYESDDFSGTLAKWTQTSGSWSIVSGTAQTSSANAKLTCNTTHPSASNKYLATIAVKFTADGDVMRLYIDNSNYYGELERINSTCCRLRLYDNSGALTLISSIGGSLSPWARVVVCSDGDTVYVSLGGAVYLSVPAIAASSIVALGTGTCAGTVSFEDFTLSKHYDDDNTCPACGNENCVWFSDPGCASGSLSATDYTATGTWAYDSGYIKASDTDGTLAVNIENPSASFEFYASVAMRLLGNGDSARLCVGSGTHYIEVVRLSATEGVFRLVTGATCLGRLAITVANFNAIDCVLCYDGTTLSARCANSYSLAGAATIAAGDFTLEVGQVTTATYFSGLALQKHSDDLAGCPICPTPQCVWFSDNGQPIGSLSIVDYTTVGAWAYDTSTIRATTSNAVATIIPANPEGTLRFSASVTASLSSYGDVARLRVNGGSQYVEVTLHSARRMAMRLYSAGVCVGMRHLEGAISSAVLKLCYDGTKLLAMAGSAKLSIDVALTAADVSIATGNVSSSVQFDSLSVSKHNTDMEGCETCSAEPCEWFTDAGDVAGTALASSDYTTTGTWDYSTTAVVCKSSGTLAIAVPKPYSAKGYFTIPYFDVDILSWGANTEVRIYFGSETNAFLKITKTCTVDNVYTSPCSVVVCDGIEYGRQVGCGTSSANNHAIMCWDGDRFLINEVSVPFVPTDFGPRIEVDNYSGSGMSFRNPTCYKYGPDATPAISCQSCGAEACLLCAEGTFANDASISVAGITPTAYGGSCPDWTADLAAGAACSWVGWKYGLAEAYRITATLTAVTGGYKLSVVITGQTSQVTRVFEKTFLSATPLDCRVDLDGTIPFVSQGANYSITGCDYSTATLTFTVV